MFSDFPTSLLKSYPTPYYFYDLALLNQIAKDLQTAASKYQVKVHFAIKANNNLPILQLLSAKGFGADCVSAYEIERAIEGGFKPADIIFAGVGKTDDEIAYALKKGISCFNCESIQEIFVINELAAQLRKKAPIALRINPDIDAETHPKITTGTHLNKFGIPLDQIHEAIHLFEKLSHLHLKGIHLHIGSQITSMNIFKKLSARVNDIQTMLAKWGVICQSINLGGGLGINYLESETTSTPDFDQYLIALLGNITRTPGQVISIEPGRSVVASCGTLISKVLYIKETRNTRFAVIDAGMNDLIRPALYGAQHKIQNLNNRSSRLTYQVVGPICESSDVFGHDIDLPETLRGDFLAIHTVGAYGESMASTYNLRKLPKAVYSNYTYLKY